MSSDRKVALEFLRAYQKVEKIHPEETYSIFRNNMLKYSLISPITNGKKKVYVLAPQDYKRIELLDKNNVNIVKDYFHDHKGRAVTGTGSDPWFVADEKALKQALKILGGRKSARKSRKSRRGVRKSRKSVRKSRKSRRGVRKSRKSRRGVRK